MGTLNNRCRSNNNNRDPKREPNFDNHPYSTLCEGSLSKKSLEPEALIAPLRSPLCQDKQFRSYKEAKIWMEDRHRPDDDDDDDDDHDDDDDRFPGLRFRGLGFRVQGLAKEASQTGRLFV